MQTTFMTPVFARQARGFVALGPLMVCDCHAENEVQLVESLDNQKVSRRDYVCILRLDYIFVAVSVEM